MNYLRCVLVAVLLLVGSPGAAQEPAAETAAALQGLASEDWRQVLQAVRRLGELSDPASLPALEALEEGRLVFTGDGRVLIRQPRTGELQDALSGEPVMLDREAQATLRRPVLTNPIRRVLRPVVAQLQVFSPHVERRRQAAEELARRPSEAMRATIVRALEEEEDAIVKHDLRVALARLDLGSDNPQRRLEAVHTVAEVRAARLKPQLEALLRQAPDGSYLEPDPAVRAAAAEAVAAIERREALARFMSDLVFGLSMGSVLLLAALGLAIIFGLMGVINMAHGELLMIGAYTTYVVQNLFQAYLPGHFNFYLAAAVPAAFLVTGAVGIMMERGVIRFLYRRPLETLLATWGISLVLIQAARMLFGAQNVPIASPAWFAGSVQVMHGVSLSTSRLGVILFAAFVVVLVWFLMYRTRLGLEVRAVMQNREMAAAMGVPANRVDMWTFGAGAGVAGLGGVALSQIVNVGPELGQNYIVDSFMVVVLGGVGNILGAVFSAMGLGVFAKFLEPATGAVLAKIILFAFIILFIQWRPQGLFALRGRSADE